MAKLAIQARRWLLPAVALGAALDALLARDLLRTAAWLSLSAALLLDGRWASGRKSSSRTAFLAALAAAAVLTALLLARHF